MTQKLTSVFRTHYKRMLNYVRRQINNAEEAEDLLQDVFGKAAERMDLLVMVNDIPGWIWTSLRNRIIDFYRHESTKQKHGEREICLDMEGENGPLHSLIADTRQNVESEYLRKVVADVLYESLNELPEEQKEVFLLQAVEGRTFAEIAEFTGESINTVAARKRYAVSFLRKRLKEMKIIMEERNE